MPALGFGQRPNGRRPATPSGFLAAKADSQSNEQ